MFHYIDSFCKNASLSFNIYYIFPQIFFHKVKNNCNVYSIPCAWSIRPAYTVSFLYQKFLCLWPYKPVTKILKLELCQIMLLTGDFKIGKNDKLYVLKDKNLQNTKCMFTKVHYYPCEVHPISVRSVYKYVVVSCLHLQCI